MRHARSAILFSLCLLWAFTVRGQICTGSLGDPVVNIHFGAGNNPGQPLPGSIVSYSYTSVSCPDDGFYTLSNNSIGCFGNTWHNLTEDHTPNDQSGYMMVVNASTAAGVFYVDTVRGLCGGTTYEFAAWIVNMLRPSACNNNGVTPNLTFSIETTTGVVLGSYRTGDIAATSQAEWKQYGLFFTTPAAQTAVVLRITNSNPGGCGNDLAIDDITFRPCGPRVTVSFSDSHATPYHLCEGSTAVIEMEASVSAGFTNPAYQWQASTNGGMSWQDIPGATTTRYQRPPSGPGSYLYRLAVAESGNMGISNCRIASNAIEVWVHDLPAKTIASNSPVCEGQRILLSAATGTSFAWTGPNGFTASGPQPSLDAVPAAAGTYTVAASDDYGCTNTNSTGVSILISPTVTTNSSASACEGTAVTLTATGAQQYRWMIWPDTTTRGTGASVTLSPPAASNPYQVAVVGSLLNGCADTAFTSLQVYPPPTANAGPDLYIFAGDTAVLQGSATAASRYYWQPPAYLNDPQSLQARATPPVSQAYTLFAESAHGCGTATDAMQVYVYEAVQIPNVFSPNGDGINDTWQIRALASYPDCRVQVFDRYGRLLLSQTNYNTPWDGRYRNQPLPAGVYYFAIDLRVANRLLKGSVTILR